jgi:hypothetical protein
MMQRVGIFMGSGDKLVAVNEAQLNLLDLLKKFGIKSSEMKLMYTFTANLPAGQYSISGTIISSSSNAFTITGTAVVPRPVQYKPSKKTKTKKTQDKRQWRSKTDKHSRNTGRTIGRR